MVCGSSLASRVAVMMGLEGVLQCPCCRPLSSKGVCVLIIAACVYPIAPSGFCQVNPIGAVILESCYTEAGNKTDDDKYCTFKIIFDAPDARAYELACESEELMLEWMKVS